MKRNLLICSILIIVLIFSIIINSKQKTDTGGNIYYVEADSVYDNPSLEEMTGLADNVFIATVEDVIGNYYNKEKDLMPYTTYKMTVLKNYKGNLKKEIIISKNGGYDENDELYLINGMDEKEWKLVPSEKYLLFAFAQQNGELLIASIDGTYNLESTSSSKSFKTIEVYSNDISNKYFNIEFQKILDREVTYERTRYTSNYELY